jgi:hypothetical protein
MPNLAARTLSGRGMRIGVSCSQPGRQISRHCPVVDDSWIWSPAQLVRDVFAHCSRRYNVFSTKRVDKLQISRRFRLVSCVVLFVLLLKFLLISSQLSSTEQVCAASSSCLSFVRLCSQQPFAAASSR